ncbi:(2Fe-2S)-binding protein [Mycobacterium sp. CVI_P3]|uniref:Bacterioferritin-associated ferredoxin n=1 Tax=Mycobacterium pinniadriaticum TaxID=2994102 RepID=A0ABT3S949_9MYCO|nr:(2Fe-2S)-binding protein [Mycobacterium pinniadriaticum]MCX2929612.1 (2Fe-2S)-binding protein [Mycobacterium pinniadriaticum]MCX2936036.1 (2Fe-2S)-binding protein [Mycobacterium pinniadriaticum]
MYVCLCAGATSATVKEAVAGGACTSKQVAAACGAGGDCGRCRRTVRAIIEQHFAAAGESSCRQCTASLFCQLHAGPRRGPARVG